MSPDSLRSDIALDQIESSLRNIADRWMASIHELPSGEVGWYRRLEFSDRVGTVATANAIVSLRSSGTEVPRSYDAVRTLVARQRNDGGWSFISNISEVSVVDATAAVISALQEWHSVAEFHELHLPAVLEKALDWLESACLPEAGWGLIADSSYRSYSSALAVQALCIGGRRGNPAVQKALRRFIAEADPLTGGWHNSNRQVSVPVTAEVMRALQAGSTQVVRYASQISKGAAWLLSVAKSTRFWEATHATANVEEIEVFIDGRRTRIEYGYSPRPLAIHALSLADQALAPDVVTAVGMMIGDLHSDRWTALAGQHAVPTSWMLLDIVLALVAFRGALSQHTSGVSGERQDPLTMADMESRAAPSNVVIALHGIRTRGKWQNELTPLLNRADFTVAPLDYGFFGALRLLLPWSRQKKVEWFLRKFTSERNRLQFERPSIVAHSFGTYIVARALVKYTEITVDRVILCASIVPSDFDWAKVAAKGQARGVLNQFGGRDIWPKIAHRLISDAGDSGSAGFKKDAPGVLLQQSKPLFGHSDYFYDLNYQNNWIPFLRGEQPDLSASTSVPLEGPESPPGTNRFPKEGSSWKKLAIFGVLFFLVISALFFIYRGYFSH